MSGQEIQRRSPQQELIHVVRSDTFVEQVKMALPPTVTAERFVRVTTTALMTNPDIAKLEQNSVLRCLVQAASLGLMPDGKEAAIVQRKGNATLVPMIGGYRKKAAEHGWTLRTAVVYANDDFTHAVIDGEETIQHAPVRPGADRGDLIAAYAIATHRDRRRMMVVLHPDDIAKRRASASTQKVWEEHPAAMWEKSAGRDLFDQLGLAELDESITRMIAAAQTDPDEAAAQLYGEPATDSAGELPVGGQQAAAAATTPAAAAAPGTAEPEPEPSLVDETLFAPPAGAVEDDPHVAAALEASQYRIPGGGDNGGLTLAEVQAKGPRGVNWLRWALANITTPAEYRHSVRAFCRVYEPDLYQAALAAEEAAA